jgi:hypothetical protein
MPMAQPQPSPDFIDLAASAIAAKLTVVLAAEIAHVLRRAVANPAGIGRRADLTAVARQRAHRARLKKRS